MSISNLKTWNGVAVNQAGSGIDSYTTSCLHMNGTDGSTTFTDNGTNAVSWTADNSAQIDTAQSKFGGASGLFTRTSQDTIHASASSNWDFGSGSFTVDFWVRFKTIPTSAYSMLFGINDFYLGEYHNGSVTRLHFRSKSGGVTIETDCTFVVDTWYHIAIMRDGNSWMYFQDGVKIGDTKTSSESQNLSTYPCYVGGWELSNLSLDGWIDEFRISKGIARFSSSGFTPPTSEYTSTQQNLKTWNGVTYANLKSWNSIT